MRLAVDGEGRLHAGFTASGAGSTRKMTLVYGRIATRSDFRSMAGAKSFVRLTGQRELAMPKDAPGYNSKSGACAVAAGSSPLSLIAVALLVPFILILRRRVGGPLHRV
jgi:hypothetical protein